MGVSRKEKERQQRRALLLEAAAAVFARRTFDEATMQEVAAEAEIGMQGLYEHFPSKQDLYEQLVTGRADAFRARADEALRGVVHPLEQLRVLADVYVRHFRETPMFLPLFIRDRVLSDWGLKSRFDERFRRIYEEELLRLRRILESAMDQGLVRALDPGFLTRACLGVLEASLHVTHGLPEEEVNACVNRAMDCFLSGVGARP